MRYLIEITLYNNQHLDGGSLSVLADCESTEAVRKFRSSTMVESVAVIELATGAVLCDLPSFTCLARAKHRTEHTQLPLS